MPRGKWLGEASRTNQVGGEPQKRGDEKVKLKVGGRPIRTGGEAEKRMGLGHSYQIHLVMNLGGGGN